LQSEIGVRVNNVAFAFGVKLYNTYFLIAFMRDPLGTS
jgi:hypothetical protein